MIGYKILKTICQFSIGDAKLEKFTAYLDNNIYSPYILLSFLFFTLILCVNIFFDNNFFLISTLAILFKIMVDTNSNKYNLGKLNTYYFYRTFLLSFILSNFNIYTRICVFLLQVKIIDMPKIILLMLLSQNRYVALIFLLSLDLYHVIDFLFEKHIVETPFGLLVDEVAPKVLNEIFKDEIKCRNVLPPATNDAGNYQDIPLKQIILDNINHPYIFIEKTYKEAIDEFCRVSMHTVDQNKIDFVCRRILGKEEYSKYPGVGFYVKNSVVVAAYYFNEYIQNVKLDIQLIDRAANIIGSMCKYKRLLKRTLIFRNKEFERVLGSLIPGVIGGRSLGYIYHLLPSFLQKKKIPDLHLPLMKYVGDRMRHFVRFAPFNDFYANNTPDYMNKDALTNAYNYRLSMEPPEISNKYQEELTKTVQEMLIPRGKLMDFEDWLIKNKSYTLNKKAKINDIYENRSLHRNKAFAKNESYGDEYKPDRMIIDAAQDYKNVEARVVASLDEEFMHELPTTLCGKPVKDWPQIVTNRISELGDNVECGVGDITSFEVCIGKDLKSNCENNVYDKFLIDFPYVASFLRNIQESQRKIYLKDGRTIKRPAFRFSGDQRTYQANTLDMHIVLTTAFRMAGVSKEDYRFFVSGDDSLMAVRAGLGYKFEEVVKHMKEMGLVTKFNRCTVGNSDFCGFCFNPESPKGRFAKDPVKVLLNLLAEDCDVGKKSYFKKLGMKAYCTLHEYPADPVLKQGLLNLARIPSKDEVLTYWQHELLGVEPETLEELMKYEVETFDYISEVTGEDKEFLIKLSSAFNKFSVNRDNETYSNLMQIVKFNDIEKHPKRLHYNLNHTYALTEFIANDSRYEKNSDSRKNDSHYQFKFNYEKFNYTSNDPLCFIKFVFDILLLTVEVIINLFLDINSVHSFFISFIASLLFLAVFVIGGSLCTIAGLLQLLCYGLICLNFYYGDEINNFVQNVLYLLKLPLELIFYVLSKPLDLLESLLQRIYNDFYPIDWVIPPATPATTGGISDVILEFYNNMRDTLQADSPIYKEMKEFFRQ